MEGGRERIQKVTHFHAEIPLSETATIEPYKSLHTKTTKKSKKSKKKFEQFSYYQFPQDKNKIMKVLYKDNQNYLVNGYYPFTDPISEMHNVSEICTLGLRKVIKTQAAYIGHLDNRIVIKKMTEVQLGENGDEFDTIGENFEVLQIQNRKRFDQFLKILSSHPKSLQITIRVIIDESDIEHPRIIDYEFFKREKQLMESNAVYKGIAQKVPQNGQNSNEKQNSSQNVKHNGSSQTETSQNAQQVKQ